MHPVLSAAAFPRSRWAIPHEFDKIANVMRVATFLLCLLFGGRLLAATNVWIDTDAAIGAPWREVDDGFALIAAFHSPQLHIVGISSTYGNAGLTRTAAVTRDIVRRFGAAGGVADANVFPGARQPRDFGSTAAVNAIARTLRTQKLTYVALGPLTNLAALLQTHPKLAPRFKKVILVGGRSPGRALTFGRNGSLQIHDANIFKDPAAARIVLHSRVPLLLAPVESGGQLLLTQTDARQLSAGGDAAHYLHRRSRAWLWFWTSVVGNRGGPLFDALAVTAAARPESLPIEKRYASMRPTGELMAAPKPVRGAREVSFCTGVGAETKTTLMRALLYNAAEH
ncbi:MAG: nucleoside hydrolase [Verrucomicrobiota bacterium]|nr:nucleoside hydrolase [Verrucomicrobiota bacterium]